MNKHHFRNTWCNPFKRKRRGTHHFMLSISKSQKGVQVLVGYVFRDGFNRDGRRRGAPVPWTGRLRQVCGRALGPSYYYRICWCCSADRAPHPSLFASVFLCRRVGSDTLLGTPSLPLSPGIDSRTHVVSLIASAKADLARQGRISPAERAAGGREARPATRFGWAVPLSRSRRMGGRAGSLAPDGAH